MLCIIYNNFNDVKYIFDKGPVEVNKKNIEKYSNYEDLIKNPLLVIQEIYTKFNFSLEKENKELMKSYIERSVITRKEKHIYTLEEYGLTKKEVHNRLQ